MTRLRVVTAPEIEDLELRATMGKVGEDVAFGIYGHCPDLLMWGRLHRAFDVPASGPGYHAMLANESGLTGRTT